LYYVILFIRLLLHRTCDQIFSFTRETSVSVLLPNDKAILVAVVKREVGSDGECIPRLHIHRTNPNAYLCTCISQAFDRRGVLTFIMYPQKVKVKFTLEQSLKTQRGSRGTVNNHFLTSAIDGGGRSTPRPDRFTSGKETRYPFYRRLGEPHSRSGRVRKSSPPREFDPRTVQSAAGC
jgi:hypothetical protein